MTNASQSIDQKLRSLGGWRAEALAEARRLIHEADPDMVEEIKWVKPSNPHGVPVWAHDGIGRAAIGTRDRPTRTAAVAAFPMDASMAFPRAVVRSDGGRVPARPYWYY